MLMKKTGILAISVGLALSASALASSHREAPQITETPKVDATDFYMFNSYETGRDGFVTVIANYLPLQDAYGGPNYFGLDTDAVYEIHFDTDGDATEDITFQFKFSEEYKGIALDVGPEGQTESVEIPLKQAGGISAGDNSLLNVIESYSINVIRGPRRGSIGSAVTAVADGSTSFVKPVDNIGNKTIPDYDAYANQYIYDVAIPECSPGKVFVGQRKEGFVVNLGETFDLVNYNPVGANNAEANDLDDKNVTSIAMEIPADCVTAGGSTIVGAWTSASLRQARVLNPNPRGFGDAQVSGGALTQVSRLGMPLVNEVVIGLGDKDLFNTSHPSGDGQFLTYVSNPTLPELLEILFGVTAPNAFPRDDLISVFLTGVTGLNQPEGVAASEMLRLNTSIAAVPAVDQSPLGVLAGDNAGFPNGRRPGDDVVDAALRVVMGVLLDPA
ncbi:MAG: DUF4331 domain-containing protein, partial [Gammaproteobacteria bacterium]|nr:DUF4331 domain-containing protein [Gammaproteobacteria bacterium]